MSEEELLTYMKFTDTAVIFNRQFYENVIVRCMDKSVNDKKIIDKAIEFVEDYKNQFQGDEVEYDMINLLSILQGKEMK